MATLATLMTKARQRADMENSKFVEDPELITLISDSYAELYDLLVSKFEDWYVDEPVEFEITSGNTHTLTSSFYKLVGIDKYVGGRWVALKNFNFNERNKSVTARSSRGLHPNVEYRLMGDKLRFTPEDNALGTYRYWQIPAHTPLTDDADTVDSNITRNGWDEYIAIDAGIKMLLKEESDASGLMARKAEIKARIEDMAQNRDEGECQTVTDVYQGYYDNSF